MTTIGVLVAFVYILIVHMSVRRISKTTASHTHVLDILKQRSVDEIVSEKVGEFKSLLEEDPSEIIKEILSGYRLPPTWWELVDDFDKAIAKQRKEAARLAELESLASDKTTFEVRPPVFDTGKEYSKWYDNINKFLKRNGLGRIGRAGASPYDDNLVVELKPGISVPDVEEKLWQRYKPFNRSKAEQDWAEDLYEAARHARKVYSWDELNKPSSDYNEAMNKLKQLYISREMLVQTAAISDTAWSVSFSRLYFLKCMKLLQRLLSKARR